MCRVHETSARNARGVETREDRTATLPRPLPEREGSYARACARVGTGAMGDSHAHKLPSLLGSGRGGVSLRDVSAITARIRRRGLSLIELTFSMLVMALVAGTLVALSHGVETSNEYSQGYGTATQHARVALERIDRTVNEAYGKGTYPGVWVTQDTDGTWTYPNTLIVWHPAATPVNPAGPPLVQELVVFCPDPNTPGNLLQMTWPGNTTPMPSDSASLTTLINSLKSSGSSSKVVLTTLLRVVSVSAGGSTSTSPAVRRAVRGDAHAVRQHLGGIHRRNTLLEQFAVGVGNS